MILIQNTVKQITFGDSSSYQNGLLTVSKEELSAAAVTRGIEDPAPKTSLVELRASPVDSAAFVVGVGLTAALLAAKLGVFPW